MAASERVVIVYHANCPDGFGGAYAAWKRFGDTAEYHPLSYNDPVPDIFSGARVYFIDFCYTKDIMDRIRGAATELVVLDHHKGSKDVVESIPGHVYDDTRSGATIAWTYFHPDRSVPVLLKYVEDGDLYRFGRVDARALLAYVYNEPFTFPAWEHLEKSMEDARARMRMAERGRIYEAYKESILVKLVEGASLVSFEGHTCLLSPTLRIFTSDLGNRLAKKQPPLSLLLSAREDGLRVSLRGDGTVDVAEIARTYGGNGHPNSAAFSLSYGVEPPWKPINDENTGN